MTGLLLTVFLIGAFSSNRSTGLAHVPCLYSIGKPFGSFLKQAQRIWEEEMHSRDILLVETETIIIETMG